MCGVVLGAGAQIAASGGGSDAGRPDSGSGERRGASFADGVVGTVVSAFAGDCGGAPGASGTSSAGVAGTGCGVVDKHVSASVSPGAAFSRCRRSGSFAAGSVMPASGDMSRLTGLEKVENTSSRVLGSRSLSGVLRTAEAWGLSWGNASGVKGLSPWLRHAGRLVATGRW